ncbi:RHS repeat-associated core domain-containing protein [Pseudomonas xanthosomatis]|uniref:RHS repeat-associated core domain-containing protein n=1 Tax=Pseudomonas xanthosomatis TaxID=2842356 RepID=UPI001C3CA79D|nr:RHS repeat-associated core domain-containing protein [Pseudomonas xanthosomatis]QXH46374.1 RHS repeat-associated core domain-containing protein [Pseudomonas xanthosomatis]
MSNVLLKLDQQQSVLTGTAGHSRAYTPYGAPYTVTGPGLGFCGQHRDPLTGYYGLGNGHRYYSPTLMRFVSADALSPFGLGGVNAYAYCGGDPINRIDPGAQWWRRVLGASSSSVTLTGAVIRTARNEALRLQHEHRIAQGHPSSFSPPPLLNRIGNTAFAATGASGALGNVLQGFENAWADDSLITLASGFGLANSGGNITGGVFSNFTAARETWTLMGQPGIASSRVVSGTFLEITGIRMVSEAVEYAGRRAWELGEGVVHFFRAGAEGWWRWRAGRNQAADIRMNNTKSP